MYRDITMKEISEQYIGQTLQVAGWIENIRDHGGVSFIDLRDMYGVLQVVMRDTSLLDGLTKEMCVSIEGLVNGLHVRPHLENRVLSENIYQILIPLKAVCTAAAPVEAHKIFPYIFLMVQCNLLRLLVRKHIELESVSPKIPSLSFSAAKTG